MKMGGVSLSSQHFFFRMESLFLVYIRLCFMHALSHFLLLSLFYRSFYCDSLQVKINARDREGHGCSSRERDLPRADGDERQMPLPLSAGGRANFARGGALGSTA